MWNIIKEYRHYLASVFLAIIPLIALNSGGKSAADFHWFDRAAVTVSAPVQGAISWMIDMSWGVAEDYLLLLNVRQNNSDLSYENRQLQNEIANLQEMARENERLRKVVEFGLEIPGKKIVARVIAQDVSSEFRVIRLDKGSNEGIEKGMAVVTPEGIVGRVLRVTGRYSDVLTLLDSSSAIDALSQRSRARGVIEGISESLLAFKYLRRTDDIEVGDMVVSSGIGGLFPKGLAVGKVSRVERKSYGITQTVEVTPAVDFSKLEEVTVVEATLVPLTEELPIPPSISVVEKAKAAKSAEAIQKIA
jgi:rod shape-determining protein MreC